MSGVKYTNVEKSSNFLTTLTPILTLVAIAGIFAGVGMLGQVQKDVDNLTSVIGPMHVPASVRSPMPGVNTCAGKKAEIEEVFGFRTVRNSRGEPYQLPQPWCWACRSSALHTSEAT